MKYEIKNIQPDSYFRFVFFVTLIAGAVLASAYLIISIFTGLFILGIIIFAFGVPVLALIAASLFYLIAKVYNIFALKFGGIIIYLDNKLKN